MAYLTKKEADKIVKELSKSSNKEIKSIVKKLNSPEKSRIIPLSKGIDFVGFKSFYYHRALRKRNIKNILSKIKS